MRARVRDELHLLLVDIPRAGSKCMQHWLPHVGPATVDEADARHAAAAESLAQPGRERQARHAPPTTTMRAASSAPCLIANPFRTPSLIERLLAV